MVSSCFFEVKIWGQIDDLKKVIQAITWKGRSSKNVKKNIFYISVDALIKTVLKLRQYLENQKSYDHFKFGCWPWGWKFRRFMSQDPKVMATSNFGFICLIYTLTNVWSFTDIWVGAVRVPVRPVRTYSLLAVLYCNLFWWWMMLQSSHGILFWQGATNYAPALPVQGLSTSWGPGTGTSYFYYTKHKTEIYILILVRIRIRIR